ncbi:aminotransferase-like domain-containing protein [Arenibaculum pallidiluteum]|uniref:aminotransferase-like domain-containing protein n=1 Tax=Arenibaculum pallidiluteum TaxID=2812559 RepID=UPI001A95F09E|nr:PLP-dependent aminotransferase family protein [Arenibaculum pallidiluteum]
MGDKLALGFMVPLARDGGVPVFAQIRDRLIAMIDSGEIAAGTRLPPIRALASTLSVNPMTVAKAYRELAERGHVRSRGSGGTFVLAGASPPPAGDAPPGRPEPQAVPLTARLFELARAPGVIGFTANYPGPAEGDVVTFRRRLSELAQDPESDRFFRYDPPAGRLCLREEIARMAEEQGMSVRPGEVMVTAGGQQAIDLVVRALLRPGDLVLVERPTYFGALNAMREAGARFAELPLGPDGPDLGRLEVLLAAEPPRLVYLNPTFQNPTGATLGAAKRQAILDLLIRRGVPLLEDDHCPELRFRGDPVPPFRALPGAAETVFYARGFGKALVPGVRLGFLLAPAWAHRRLAELKSLTDLQSNAFMQGALASWLASDRVATVERLVRVYGARQQALVDALRAGLPPGSGVSQPDGGLSLWIALPGEVPSGDIYYRAVNRGVAFVPGAPFYATAPDSRTMRLSFGLVPDHEIREGARRLCSLICDLSDPSMHWASWAV